MSAAVGDFLVRLCAVQEAGRRKVRGKSEYTIVFGMEGGNALHVGLKDEDEVIKLRDMLDRSISKARRGGVGPKR